MPRTELVIIVPARGITAEEIKLFLERNFQKPGQTGNVLINAEVAAWTGQVLK